MSDEEFYWATDDFGKRDAETLEAAAYDVLRASAQWDKEGEVPVSFAVTEAANYRVSVLVSPRWILQYAPARFGDPKFKLGLRNGEHVYIFGTDMQTPGDGKSLRE